MFFRVSAHVRAVGCGLFLFFAGSAFAKGDLVINSMHSDATAQKAFNVVLDGFKKEYPDINVKVNLVDHESFKVQIRTWLPNNPPDITTWFSGYRAKYFADKGLIEPIDDVWAKVGDELNPATRTASTFNGHAYLMPANYYHWGIYYRKDLFKKAGIEKSPETWKDLLDTVAKLNKEKIIPFTIGTKFRWPAAAWFDFLDMRVNGYDFHMNLLAGKESYEDARVKKAFGYWDELLKLRAFPEDASAMSWQEASALLWQGKAAMYLMGNFISTEIPKDMHGKIGFFGFPEIDPKVARAEVAPTDCYFIPAKAKNKENAKLFLTYFARSDVQRLYHEVNRMLPANIKTKIVEDDEFLQSGRTLLESAADLAQFYDRDADPEVANAGMDGLVEFMSHPERIDSILATVEKKRARVHGKLNMKK